MGSSYGEKSEGTPFQRTLCRPGRQRRSRRWRHTRGVHRWADPGVVPGITRWWLRSTVTTSKIATVTWTWTGRNPHSVRCALGGPNFRDPAVGDVRTDIRQGWAPSPTFARSMVGP